MTLSDSILDRGEEASKDHYLLRQGSDFGIDIFDVLDQGIQP